MDTHCDNEYTTPAITRYGKNGNIEEVVHPDGTTTVLDHFIGQTLAGAAESAPKEIKHTEAYANWLVDLATATYKVRNERIAARAEERVKQAALFADEKAEAKKGRG